MVAPPPCGIALAGALTVLVLAGCAQARPMPDQFHVEHAYLRSANTVQEVAVADPAALGAFICAALHRGRWSTDWTTYVPYNECQGREGTLATNGSLFVWNQPDPDRQYSRYADDAELARYAALIGTSVSDPHASATAAATATP
jgi:hypothetical protein